MIERVSEGPYFPLQLSTVPTAFTLGRDGKANDAPFLFRNSGSGGSVWNGTQDKRVTGRSSAPPPGTQPPPPTETLVPYTGVTEVYKMAPEGGFFPPTSGARGRLPKNDEQSVTPPGTSHPNAPPVANLPPIPPPSADPGDVGHDTDDNIDDLTDLFRETFTGTPSGGGATSGGGSVIVPSQYAAAEMAGGGGGGGGGLVTILVLLALGAAGYFGWKWYKKRKGQSGQ